MKKVLMITDVDFWRLGAGHRTRIKTLVEYLGKHSRLKIVFAGPEMPNDYEILNKDKLSYNLIFLNKTKKLSVEEFIVSFKIVLRDYYPDFCIVEYIHLTFAKSFLPSSTITILDTHDITSEKAKSFQNFGYQYKPVNLKDEIEVFKKYDKVILIQKSEYSKISEFINPSKLLLIPHPVEFSKQKIRTKVKKLGFIGSEYMPNIDGMKWFLKDIFPTIEKGLELHIYGRVCSHLKGFQSSNVILHGFVADVKTMYSSIDIVLNPVRFGAGLKIKNVEALGNGLPLITTPHGAMGLESQINRAFLVANDSKSFTNQLDFLADYQKRKSISEKALHFIKEHYSPSKCFKPLIDFINHKKGPRDQPFI